MTETTVNKQEKDCVISYISKSFIILFLGFIYVLYICNRDFDILSDSFTKNNITLLFFEKVFFLIFSYMIFDLLLKGISFIIRNVGVSDKLYDFFYNSKINYFHEISIKKRKNKIHTTVSFHKVLNHIFQIVILASVLLSFLIIYKFSKNDFSLFIISNSSLLFLILYAIAKTENKLLLSIEFCVDNNINLDNKNKSLFLTLKKMKKGFRIKILFILSIFIYFIGNPQLEENLVKVDESIESLDTRTQKIIKENKVWVDTSQPYGGFSSFLSEPENIAERIHYLYSYHYNNYGTPTTDLNIYDYAKKVENTKERDFSEGLLQYYIIKHNIDNIYNYSVSFMFFIIISFIINLIRIEQQNNKRINKLIVDIVNK